MVEDFVEERLEQIPKNLRPAVQILIREIRTLTKLNDQLMKTEKHWRESTNFWMEQLEKKAPEMFEDAG